MYKGDKNMFESKELKTKFEKVTGLTIVDIDWLFEYNDKLGEKDDKELIHNDILFKTLTEVREYNFQSNYWKDAETMQEDAEDAFNNLEEFMNKKLLIVYPEDDNASSICSILGISIDKQYNDHISIVYQREKSFDNEQELLEWCKEQGYEI